MRVTIEGFDKVRRNIDARLNDRDITNAVKRGVRAGMGIVRDEAKARVPVDTGLLQRSITTTVSSKRGQITGRVVIKDRAFYWRFIELGSSRISARPFLRPSFAMRKDAAYNALRRELRSTLRL